MNRDREFGARNDPSHTPFINVAQLVPRPIGPGEIAQLRAMLWRQAALGHRLPAERGVILIAGGKL